jgi:hypothetical protein
MDETTFRREHECLKTAIYALGGDRKSKIALIKSFGEAHGLDMSYLDILDEDKLIEECVEAYTEEELDRISAYLEGRDRVCAMEIWVEIYGGGIDDLDKLHAREINTILGKIPGWKKYKNKLRFQKYGLQRCFVRDVNPAS